jgi:hypothetical protein
MEDSNSNNNLDTETKFIVPIKLSEKSSRLTDDVKNELRGIGMMDD